MISTKSGDYHRRRRRTGRKTERERAFRGGGGCTALRARVLTPTFGWDATPQRDRQTDRQGGKGQWIQMCHKLN